jgi:hypothetical protein
MKLTFAVIAAVMASAAPVMAQQEPEIKYHIKYIDSTNDMHNDLKDFNMQRDDKSAKYKNDSYTTPKLFIEEMEINNFFKKAN